jgi:hypothetical protein
MAVNTLINQVISGTGWTSVVNNTTGWSATLISGACLIAVGDVSPLPDDSIGIMLTANGYRDTFISNSGGNLWCKSIDSQGAIISVTTW